MPWLLNSRKSRKTPISNLVQRKTIYSISDIFVHFILGHLLQYANFKLLPQLKFRLEVIGLSSF